jgi:hypothetical protein
MRQDIILTDYKEKINNVVQKIDAVYREIKKNEISPKMDYLFNGSAKSDLDKTIAKLDILNAYHSAASTASTGSTFSNGVESDDNDEPFRLNE